MTEFQGMIFDVDGVLVDSPHEKAWRESLRELMESTWRDIRDQTTWSPEGFTPRVYQEYVSGKPRISGARAALDHFAVPDAEHRVVEYAERKQDMVVRLIEAGDFTAYPDALRFVIAAKDSGVRIADASSSKNAALFLRKIRLDTFAEQNEISSESVRPGLALLDYFDADVSGRDFARGKPDPEIFLTAASELGVEPQYTIVIEDAAAGVQAAKAAGMAAIGIARADDAGLLTKADLVVTTLDDVDTTALAGGHLGEATEVIARTPGIAREQSYLDHVVGNRRRVSGMSTFDEVAQLALALPEVTDGERRGNRTWFVNGKAFAWERPFSKADIKRFGDATPPTGPILAVRVADLAEKDAVLAANPRAFFTIPHFNGYAAVLIQLENVSKKALREALLDGWLSCAPPRLTEPYRQD